MATIQQGGGRWRWGESVDLGEYMKAVGFSYKLGDNFKVIAADGRNVPICNFKVVPGCPSRKGLGRGHVTRQVEGGESVVGCIVNNVTRTLKISSPLLTGFS
ncbi:hypothetical protein GH733_008445, partial [Mirounga leonina]